SYQTTSGEVDAFADVTEAAAGKLPAAQRSGLLPKALPENREVADHLVTHLGRAAAAVADREVLLDGQLAEERLLLGGVGDAHPGDAVGRPAGDVLGADHHGALHRLDVAHHCFQQRRLAHAVTADDRERADRWLKNFAAADFKDEARPLIPKENA